MKQVPIYKTLKASPEVVALLGDKIYEDLAPTGTVAPYLVWSEVTGTIQIIIGCTGDRKSVV